LKKLIWCTLAAALGLHAQSPTVIGVSDGRGVFGAIPPGEPGNILGFQFGTVENTRVTIANENVPVVAASAGQLRVEFPPDLAAGPAILRVTVDGRPSADVPVTIAPPLHGRVIRGEGSISAGPEAGVPPHRTARAATVTGGVQTAGNNNLVYTCDSTLTAVSSTACTTLNTTIAGLYSAAFDNVSAQIYIKLGTTALGHSSYTLNQKSYSAFRTALVAAESDANDASAIAGSVPLSSPYPADQVMLTNALDVALGSSPGYGMMADGSTFCPRTNSACYDGVITISNAVPLFFRSGTISSGQFDFFTAVEHETDEILGTASCTFGTCGGPYIMPPDLFRYHSDGSLSFAAGTNHSCSTSDSTNACFSLDGAHMLQQYNNVNNGLDAGDWNGSCGSQLVQDASLCAGVGGVDIAAGSEILVLDVIGYKAPASGAIVGVSSSTGNGAYGAGASISIQVTFGETVTVTGLPQLALNSGGTAHYSSGSGTRTLTFTYVVASGESSNLLDYSSVNALTLNGGAITGSAVTVVLTLPAPGAAGSLSAAGTIVIDTLTGSVTIQTSPTGLKFSVDGGTVVTAPQTLTLNQASHTIAVSATQPGATGTQYVFTGWSDSGAASHSIVVGPAPATYTATFKTQYRLTTSASPTAGGTVTPASGSFFDSGTAAAITATPNAGYNFASWTGAAANAGNASTTVTMSAPETVTATFLKPLLSVTLMHSGSFVQLQQNATYTVTVSDGSGAGATRGTVTVTEAPPTGLTIASMSGSGWTCLTGSVTCSRSDPLSPSGSYAAITVTATVSGSAPATLTNQVTVSGGASASATANDPTTIARSPCDVTLDGVVTVADLQRMVSEVLGTLSAANDLNSDGAVNLVDMQIEGNALLGLGCKKS
jgi:hypothetical protein